MKFYWGAPANPGQLRFHTGTLLSKSKDKPRMGQKHFATHEIVALFGLQIGKSFIGRMSLGQWGVEHSLPEPYKPKRQRRAKEARDGTE